MTKIKLDVKVPGYYWIIPRHAYGHEDRVEKFKELYEVVDKKENYPGNFVYGCRAPHKYCDGTVRMGFIYLWTSLGYGWNPYEIAEMIPSTKEEYDAVYADLIKQLQK